MEVIFYGPGVLQHIFAGILPFKTSPGIRDSTAGKVCRNLPLNCRNGISRGSNSKFTFAHIY